MVTGSIKRTTSSHQLQQESMVSNLIQERLQNIGKKFIKTIDLFTRSEFTKSIDTF